MTMLLPLMTTLLPKGLGPRFSRDLNLDAAVVVFLDAADLERAAVGAVGRLAAGVQKVRQPGDRLILQIDIDGELPRQLLERPGGCPVVLEANLHGARCDLGHAAEVLHEVHVDIAIRGWLRLGRFRLNQPSPILIERLVEPRLGGQARILQARLDADEEGRNDVLRGGIARKPQLCLHGAVQADMRLLIAARRQEERTVDNLLRRDVRRTENRSAGCRRALNRVEAFHQPRLFAQTLDCLPVRYFAGIERDLLAGNLGRVADELHGIAAAARKLRDGLLHGDIRHVEMHVFGLENLLGDRPLFKGTNQLFQAPARFDVVRFRGLAKGVKRRFADLLKLFRRQFALHERAISQLANEGIDARLIGRRLSVRNVRSRQNRDHRQDREPASHDSLQCESQNLWSGHYLTSKTIYKSSKPEGRLRFRAQYQWLIHHFRIEIKIGALA